MKMHIFIYLVQFFFLSSWYRLYRLFHCLSLSGSPQPSLQWWIVPFFRHSFRMFTFSFIEAREYFGDDICLVSLIDLIFHLVGRITSIRSQRVSGFVLFICTTNISKRGQFVVHIKVLIYRYVTSQIHKVYHLLFILVVHYCSYRVYFFERRGFRFV